MLGEDSLKIVGPYLASDVLCLGHPDGDTHRLFGSVRCVDIRRRNGCEDIVDLNCPQDLGQYDLVLDHGTIEHCFHVGQALLNAANAVKVGGHIFHSPPLTIINHGYYSISPVLFTEFYRVNGWAMRYIMAHKEGTKIVVDGTKRCRDAVPIGAWLYVLAKRINGSALQIPLQAKYG